MGLFDNIRNALVTDDSSQFDESLESFYKRCKNEELQEEVSIPTNVESTGTDFIKAVYEMNGKTDKSHSIYMVDVYMNTLPSEMLSTKKAETVINILSASGITKEEVLNDAEDRKMVLDGVNTQVKKEETEKINNANVEIERLKQLIDEQNQIINLANKKVQDIDTFIQNETKFIDNLVKSIGGEK